MPCTIDSLDYLVVTGNLETQEFFRMKQQQYKCCLCHMTFRKKQIFMDISFEHFQKDSDNSTYFQYAPNTY